MDGVLQAEVAETAPLESGLSPVRSAQAQPPRSTKGTRPRRIRLRRWLVLSLVLAASAVVAELHFAVLQSGKISRYATSLSYSLQPGPSDAIVFPRDGPFDKRLGYSRLPSMLARLQERDFVIREQARFSTPLLEHTRQGYFPPYSEKARAGLSISDSRGASLYRFRYPEQGYASFDAVPPLVVHSLLFIENRGLLDAGGPFANPAVDWPRFADAAALRLGKAVGLVDRPAGGASTLATQLEKYRHSPDGLTQLGADKLRQMVSASVRWYQHGPRTLAARQTIVRDYLNSVPLSAAPGYGEVNGLADGLRVWFGADFEQVNRALDPAGSSSATASERGLALRQVLSLIIAQRRPSYYLAQGRGALAALTDSHIRLLANGGVIDEELRDAALAQKLQYTGGAPLPSPPASPMSKSSSVARAHLSGLLDLPLYDLDRLDLAADTTLDAGLQDAVDAYLRHLSDPAFARQMGLFGEHLLSSERIADVRYSFTLFELTPDSYRVRVQTDSTGQPFDINEGSKLELGSTAKLRVLATYLEVIAELHQRFAALSVQELHAIDVHKEDAITRWAVDYLSTTPDHDPATMLRAAAERHYSADPGERFFTGGGVHVFSNFRPEDNGRNPTVREALRESINLPFIRLLRDVVRYCIYQAPGNSAELLSDDNDPRREEHLNRFADREGKVFLRRFWRRYEAQSPEERVHMFLDGLRPTAVRLAATHRYLSPNSSPESFAFFLRASLPKEVLSDKRVDELYRNYTPGAYTLTDQAYVAGVHPLELWLLNFLLQRPHASFADAVAASADVRREAYSWLFKSNHKGARDTRVGTMLEVEAFLDIHRRWQNLGYPFERLVPSLATAVGSSGDRPAALAELMGIIRNDGVRLPTVRIDQLRFAGATPYETWVTRTGQAKRVMRVEVATVLREALAQVVEMGTARRLQGSFKLSDGSAMTVGGKTGTGDNRIESVDRNGQVRDSRAMNRTATFVFFLGEHHFGTLTAFVPGRSAQEFSFTSALPVQVLKGMAPILTPYLQPTRSGYAQSPDTPPGSPPDPNAALRSRVREFTRALGLPNLLGFDPTRQPSALR